MFWNLDRIIKLKALPLNSSIFLPFEFDFTVYVLQFDDNCGFHE